MPAMRVINPSCQLPFFTTWRTGLCRRTPNDEGCTPTDLLHNSSTTLKWSESCTKAIQILFRSVYPVTWKLTLFEIVSDNVWYCNTKATPPIAGWIGIRGWNCQTKDNIFSWCDHLLLVISFCTYTYSLYFGYTTIPNIPWFFCCYQRITFLSIHTWHCLTSYHISKCYPFVRNI